MFNPFLKSFIVCQTVYRMENISQVKLLLFESVKSHIAVPINLSIMVQRFPSRQHKSIQHFRSELAYILRSFLLLQLLTFFLHKRSMYVLIQSNVHALRCKVTCVHVYACVPASMCMYVTLYVPSVYVCVPVWVPVHVYACVCEYVCTNVFP